MGSVVGLQFSVKLWLIVNGQQNPCRSHVST